MEVLGNRQSNPSHLHNPSPFASLIAASVRVIMIRAIVVYFSGLSSGAVLALAVTGVIQNVHAWLCPFLVYHQLIASKTNLQDATQLVHVCIFFVPWTTAVEKRYLSIQTQNVVFVAMQERLRDPQNETVYVVPDTL